MARGGKRPGAGRKPGSVNKLSAAASKAVKARGGLLPHEWLLQVMQGEQKVRDALKVDGEIVEIERLPTFEERMDAAKAAAPFYAPKLAAAALVNPDDEKNPVEELMKMAQAANSNRARPGQ
jgi:hypothetical protein